MWRARSVTDLVRARCLRAFDLDRRAVHAQDTQYSLWSVLTENYDHAVGRSGRVEDCMRFNPPPGWPTPPEGWRPPTGWLPDKSWPPVPPGWKLWIEDPRPSVPREPSIIGRTLWRSTIFAAAACVIGSFGFEYVNNLGTTFSGIVLGVLVAFIFFWCLRTPAALLELYITKRHSRRWIFWPHGLAMVAAIIAIAGNEANPGRSPLFYKVASIQAATVGLLYYLICALVFLILTAITILIINVIASPTETASASSAQKSPLTSHQGSSKLSTRSRIARLYRTPSRDAAALAVSIITAIASLVQSLDIRDIGRTALALAAGAAGLYALFKLPSIRQSSNKTTSQQLRAVGKHSKSPSPPTGAQSSL
jgi:hypothetical protein